MHVVPIASAMTAAHEDRPAVATVGQWPEILYLMPRGQIASADSAAFRHGRTHAHTQNFMCECLCV